MDKFGDWRFRGRGLVIGGSVGEVGRLEVQVERFGDWRFRGRGCMIGGSVGYL